MNRSILRASSIGRALTCTTTPAFATSRAHYSSDSKAHATAVVHQAKQEGKDAKIVADASSDKPQPTKLVVEEKHTNSSREARADGDSSSDGGRKKTVLELDEELKVKLEGISGQGGASGLEYEDGKAVAMKRGVRDNMFRYI